MGKHVIEASARTSASREAVWELVADGRGWSRWGPWRETEYERDGDPSPGGVGALRRLESDRGRGPRRKPPVLRERVTVFEPPERFGYELVSGLGVRDYHALLTLSQVDGGTELVWRAEFDAGIPGTGAIYRRELQKAFVDIVGRLAAEADRRAGAAAPA